MQLSTVYTPGDRSMDDKMECPIGGSVAFWVTFLLFSPHLVSLPFSLVFFPLSTAIYCYTIYENNSHSSHSHPLTRLTFPPSVLESVYSVYDPTPRSSPAWQRPTLSVPIAGACFLPDIVSAVIPGLRKTLLSSALLLSLSDLRYIERDCEYSPEIAVAVLIIT